MKICTKCQIEKPKAEFYRHRSGKDGIRAQCRSCMNDASRHYKEANIEKIKQINREYRQENKEELRKKAKGNYQRYLKVNPDKVRKQGREYARCYREKSPNKGIEATAKWRKTNPEKAKESRRRTREKGAERYREQRLRHREENRDKILEKERQRRQSNPEKYRERTKKWQEENREKYIELRKLSRKKNRDNERKYHTKYCKKRRSEDLLFKLITNIRIAINQAIQKNSKGGRSIALLGCSIDRLKDHLDKPGMSWDNWSPDGWHIDHIIPCAAFDFSKLDQQKQCFNFKNLQPLWAKDNMSKGAKLPTADEIKARMAI